MARWLGAVAFVGLAGCATGISPSMSRLHQACAQAYGSIHGFPACVSEIAGSEEVSESFRNSRGLQLYRTYAEALSEQVRANQLGDAEARFRLASMAAQLDQERAARSDAALERLQRHAEQEEARRKPKPRVTCSTYAGITNCYQY